MKSQLDQLVQQASTIILGKSPTIRLALACLLARGHLLIEDLPGVGKTTLAHVLARVLGLEYQRIQFTSDLLPADILGISIYDRELARFQFHPGPIFSQIILADEINRATPKTQSALLEAMEERQVTVEGQTRPLPAPFFVIATQNPTYQMGTFPLPESQLDRFLMRLEMGYPDAAAEHALLKGQDRRSLLAQLQPSIHWEQLQALQEQVLTVRVSDTLIDYLQALLAFSRHSAAFQSGLSPRAGIAVLNAARAWALLEGRDFVLPEDLQRILPAVVGHRLKGEGDLSEKSPPELAQYLIQSVPVPL